MGEVVAQCITQSIGATRTR